MVKIAIVSLTAIFDIELAINIKMIGAFLVH